ncbi:unnamed protein product [Rangifer tarandus platyrhynchus]|uniref:Uncharacterized protein n=2 Tax=Rangifer tarandus platyrhynchus TaxID=3082113 RepID=A0AC59YX54_RANTA|nr:unnamed protein product [Rangifer tarandus platyrhynchus]
MMPFQVDSVSGPSGSLPRPRPPSQLSLSTRPHAHPAQAQGSCLASPALPLESHRSTRILSIFGNHPSVKTYTLQDTFRSCLPDVTHPFPRQVLAEAVALTPVSPRLELDCKLLELGLQPASTRVLGPPA